jgi:hypothetical protein
MLHFWIASVKYSGDLKSLLEATAGNHGKIEKTSRVENKN